MRRLRRLRHVCVLCVCFLSVFLWVFFCTSRTPRCLARRLAVVTRDAQRLQVGHIKPCTARLERFDMVSHYRRGQAPLGLTSPAGGVGSQERRPHRTPLG